MHKNIREAFLPIIPGKKYHAVWATFNFGEALVRREREAKVVGGDRDPNACVMKLG